MSNGKNEMDIKFDELYIGQEYSRTFQVTEEKDVLLRKYHKIIICFIWMRNMHKIRYFMDESYTECW